jgi:hypothetical protein
MMELFDVLEMTLKALLGLGFLFCFASLCLLCARPRGEEEEDDSIDMSNVAALFYVLVLVLIYLALAAILFIIVLIGISLFNRENDCEMKAPLIHYKAALLFFGGLVFLVFVITLMTFYFLFPKYDQLLEPQEPEAAHIH